MAKSNEKRFHQPKNELTEDLFAPVLKDVDFEEEIEKLRVVERIIELRQKAGLTRKDLALRIGENESFVEQLEKKKLLVFDVSLLIRIAYALGCQLEINFRHPGDFHR